MNGINATRAKLAALVLVAAAAATASRVVAQSPAASPVKSCDANPAPAWCSAVPGDRTEGWLTQNRSEVMARNGMVTTSQPLAAEAGLDVLQKGGNAVDAAVAMSANVSLLAGGLLLPIVSETATCIRRLALVPAIDAQERGVL